MSAMQTFRLGISTVNIHGVTGFELVNCANNDSIFIYPVLDNAGKTFSTSNCPAAAMAALLSVTGFIRLNIDPPTATWSSLLMKSP